MKDPGQVLRISSDLHYALKTRAVAERTTMGKLVDEWLRKELGKDLPEEEQEVPMTKSEEWVACGGDPRKEAEWYRKYAQEVEPGILQGPGL